MLRRNLPASMSSVSRSRSVGAFLAQHTGQPLTHEQGQGQGAQLPVHAAGQAAALLAADDDGRPLRRERPAEPGRATDFRAMSRIRS